MSQDKETTQAPAPSGITPEQMKELLTSVIAAVKAPNAVEQKQLDEQEALRFAAQEARKRQAGQILEEAENKRAGQLNCTHKHSDGHSHCIWIQERVGPGYIICQKCIAVIRPGTASPNYKGAVIYDNALFNRLFQDCQSGSELFA